MPCLRSRAVSTGTETVTTAREESKEIVRKRGQRFTPLPPNGVVVKVTFLVAREVGNVCLELLPGKMHTHIHTHTRVCACIVRNLAQSWHLQQFALFAVAKFLCAPRGGFMQKIFQGGKTNVS